MRDEFREMRAPQPGIAFAGSVRSDLPPTGEGRYEYRIWPRMSHPAASSLAGNWQQVGAEGRTDIYLLTPDSDRVLIKLRDGKRLEIKALRLRTGTVECWTMPVSSEFPLTRATRHMVSDALGLRATLPEASGLTAAHFLAALHASMVPVSIRKSRLLFRSSDCQAEICRVRINDWAGHTIALESQNIPSIARAIDELSLGSLPNRSYGDLLAELRKSSPDPRRLTDGAHETAELRTLKNG